MKKKRFYGIREKMILFTILVAILPLSIVGIVLTTMINKRVTRLNMENYTYSSTKAIDNYELILKSFEELSIGYITNTYIQKTLEPGELLPEDEMYVNRGLWYHNNPYAEYCIYLDNKGNKYYRNQIQRNVELEELLPEEMIQALGEDYARAKLLYGSIQNGQEIQKGIFLIRNVRHMERDVEPGVLIVKVNEQFYQDIFADMKEHPELSAWMLSDEGEICYQQSDKNLDADVIKEVQNVSKLENGEIETFTLEKDVYFVCCDENKGFTFLLSIPIKEIQAPARMFLKITVVVMLAAIAGCVGISYFVTHSYIADIRKLSNIMSRFDGNSLNQPIQISTNTELDQMAVAYNKMLEHIKSLVDQVKKEQEELRINEFNTLVYQINPHFLYNTLDNIHMMARINKDQRTVDLIQALSQMLRISLSKGENEITLEEEVAHVSAYLEIEKMRNPQLFTYEIFLDKALRLQKIPKIILQPIVENCIKYGFAELYEGGKIGIEVTKKENEILIVIENNGIPVQPRIQEILNQMQYQSLEKIKQTFPQKQGGYGISNVVSRLCLRYGEKFQLWYERLEEGTRCCIQLPIEER